jgi:hypothetical protein
VLLARFGYKSGTQRHEVPHMMIGEGSMMIGVALSWLLVVIVLVLVGAAAFKYLFYHPTNRQTEIRRGTPTGEPPAR